MGPFVPGLPGILNSHKEWINHRGSGHSLLGDPHAMSDTSIHVAQFGLWLGTAVVWVPSLLLGYVLRKRIDRRRPAPEPRKRFKSPV